MFECYSDILIFEEVGYPSHCLNNYCSFYPLKNPSTPCLIYVCYIAMYVPMIPRGP